MKEAELSEKRYDNLVNLMQSMKNAQPPVQSEATVQPPIEDNKSSKQENGIMENLSSVQNRNSKVSNCSDSTQSNEIISTHNNGDKMVNIESHNLIDLTVSTESDKLIDRTVSIESDKLMDRTVSIESDNLMDRTVNTESDNLMDHTVSTSKKSLKYKKHKNLKKWKQITKVTMNISPPMEAKTLGVGIIECIMAFFKLMNTIFSNSLNISMGICLMLALQSALSQAAATPSPFLNENNQLTLTSMLASKQSGSSFILYPVSALETKTYTFQIAEIGQEVTNGLGTSCSSIQTLNKLCLEHPSSCNYLS